MIQEADGPAEPPRNVWTMKILGVLSGITLRIDVFLELDFQRVCKGIAKAGRGYIRAYIDADMLSRHN
jgi:hypothetical protein